MIRKGGLVGAAVRSCKQQRLPVKASCTSPAHHDLRLSLHTGKTSCTTKLCATGLLGIHIAWVGWVGTRVRQACRR